MDCVFDIVFDWREIITNIEIIVNDKSAIITLANVISPLFCINKSNFFYTVYLESERNFENVNNFIEFQKIKIDFKIFLNKNTFQKNYLDQEKGLKNNFYKFEN